MYKEYKFFYIIDTEISDQLQNGMKDDKTETARPEDPSIFEENEEENEENSVTTNKSSIIEPQVTFTVIYCMFALTIK